MQQAIGHGRRGSSHHLERSRTNLSRTFLDYMTFSMLDSATYLHLEVSLMVLQFLRTLVNGAILPVERHRTSTFAPLTDHLAIGYETCLGSSTCADFY